MDSDTSRDNFYADCQDCVFFKKGYALDIQGQAMRHSDQRYHTVIVLQGMELLTTINPPATIDAPSDPRKPPF